MSNYIAITDINNAACGATVWWELTGTVNHETLANEWDDAALPEAFRPAPPTKGHALKRALVQVTGSDKLVRRLKERGSYAVVRETINGTKGDAKLRYTTVCKVWIDENDDAKLVFDGLADTDVMLAQAIRAAYAVQRAEMTTVDVSGWLVSLANRYVHAASLRRQGGMYFVPANVLPLWNEVVEIVADAGAAHRFYQMPTLPSEHALEAISDALIHEASTAAQQVVEDMAANADLGKRALRNRKEDLAEMLGKLKAYDGLLGKRLDTVRKQVAEVEVAVVAADLARAAK